MKSLLYTGIALICLVSIYAESRNPSSGEDREEARAGAVVADAMERRARQLPPRPAIDPAVLMQAQAADPLAR